MKMGEGGDKGRQTSDLNSFPWEKRVTAANLEKNQQLYWGEVKGIHKWKLNKRLQLWGLFLLSSFVIYFILELLF